MLLLSSPWPMIYELGSQEWMKRRINTKSFARSAPSTSSTLLPEWKRKNVGYWQTRKLWIKNCIPKYKYAAYHWNPGLLRDIITLPPSAVDGVEFDARELRVVGVFLKEWSDPFAWFAGLLPQINDDDFITVNLRNEYTRAVSVTLTTQWLYAQFFGIQSEKWSV